MHLRDPAAVTAALHLALAMLAGNAPAAAANLTVDLELPTPAVAEYHRPYVALWIEREDNSVAANLSVWYQQDRGDKRASASEKTSNKTASARSGGETGAGGQAKGSRESGTKWLPDLRQWWRRSGREQTLPIDGVSGATRPAGHHTLRFSDQQGVMQSLPAGSYRLVIEAAREVGGRELMRLPFQWPPTSAQQQRVKGERELGAVSLSISP